MRVLPPHSPAQLGVSAVEAPQTRLYALRCIWAPMRCHPLDPMSPGGGGVTPEGGPPPQRARVIGASTRREMAGDAGGRTPEPQEAGPATIPRDRARSVIVKCASDA